MRSSVWGASRRSYRSPRHAFRPLLSFAQRDSGLQGFHHSAIVQQVPEDPSIDTAVDEAKKDAVTSNSEQQENEEDGGDGAESQYSTQRVRSRGDYGSNQRRSTRNRKQKEVPPLLLPEWFWKRNVSFADSINNKKYSLRLVTTEVGQGLSAEHNSANEKLPRPTDEEARYLLDDSVYNELFAAIKAELNLQPDASIELKDIPRPVLLLQCPKEEGSTFLDAVVQKVSADTQSDLLRLDSEDIAQLFGNYLGENVAWTWCNTALLGYEAHRVAGKLDTFENDEPEEDMDEGEGDEEDSISAVIKSMRSIPSTGKTAMNKFLGPGSMRPKGIIMQVSTDPTQRPMSIDQFLSASTNSGPAPHQNLAPGSEGWSDFKVTAALEALVESFEARRDQTASTSEAIPDAQSHVAATPSISRGLIIQIAEYRELTKTPQGLYILKRLRDVVKKRLRDEQKVMILGTTTTEDNVAPSSKSEIRRLQSDGSFGDQRTIYVPPVRSSTQDDTFTRDEKSYIRSINVRHVEDMIRKFSNKEQQYDAKLLDDLPEAEAFAADIDDYVWAYSQVHRIAVTMLGTDLQRSTFDGRSFGEALRLLAASDEAKFRWAGQEQEQAGLDDMLGDESDVFTIDRHKLSKEKLKLIKEKCNTHEKKLFGGIVRPADIRTTFDDVRAPPATIEALKTLTNLSLIRPEAFSYGVLATDKIPGVLLYGPPGTGKTLLAKAVAKESGATVLEVSGSEIYDMYVGEGEKNIKAVFSLAKKLSPCVVFIDEADAIFGARGDSGKRTSHRELINQFLREWDGMNDMSAFIMVATNRPFDLDEAVLRRLPRRLLVDLPLEKDRDAILKIHLKDEVLDSKVSLSNLAHDTPFYSGSDLKNLSVAAALACVREENATAASHTGLEAYVYPERRTLTKAHFDIAMDEISASISEDMSTLTAIRKFDERYGDRKGRRRKAGSLGFGGTRVEEKDSEAGRVRKSIEAGL